ncbi:hypothetical protein Vi05172_g2674 [Venturia inaequalis]|nr:hypothetical protein Vi05172_g2674 [Venturia inaequalis]
MVGFLDLSSELRQQILLAAMTDDELIDKDIEFNRMFLNVFKNENLYITIEDHLPREYLPPIAKDEDLYWVDDNEIWEIHEDAEFPIFTPVHLTSFATTLTSIHPQIEEDMTWVMEKSLSHLVHFLEAKVRPSLYSNYRSKHDLPYETLLPMISKRGRLPTTRHASLQHWQKHDWNRASNLVWIVGILKFMCTWSEESCESIKRRWVPGDEENALGKYICKVKGDTVCGNFM